MKSLEKKDIKVIDVLKCVESDDENREDDPENEVATTLNEENIEMNTIKLKRNEVEKEEEVDIISDQNNLEEPEKKKRRLPTKILTFEESEKQLEIENEQMIDATQSKPTSIEDVRKSNSYYGY